MKGLLHDEFKKFGNGTICSSRTVHSVLYCTYHDNTEIQKNPDTLRIKQIYFLFWISLSGVICGTSKFGREFGEKVHF